MGGAKTKVTSGYQPSYSPDGRRIAYTTLPVFSAFFGGDTHEIYTIKVDGSGKTRLTNNNKDEFTPDYSPDGKRIVFAGLAGLERNDAESDIYTIKAGGGGKTQVTNTDNVDDLHPVYSPDGKKIVYTVYKGNAIEDDIYTINVGGGGKFRVTHGKADEGGPAWGDVRSGFSSGRGQRSRPRGEGRGLAASALSLLPYSQSAWKRISRKSVSTILHRTSATVAEVADNPALVEES